MESLRRLMSRKEDCAWETVLNKWELFLVTSTNSFLVDSEDWNPWREWCSSWERYEQSRKKKTPKSGKERANLWRQLNYAATITRDKLDEAMAMRQELKKQKAEVTNLQQNNLLLKTKCVLLQERLDHEQQQKILQDQCHKRELEEEVNQRQSAQTENKVLRANLQDMHTKLQESSTQSRNLEYQISSLKRQLEEEVNQRQSAQKENKVLHANLQELHTKLQESSTQSRNLEYQISSLKRQLEEEVNQRQSAQKENKVLRANLQGLHTKLRESSTQSRNLEYQISSLKRQLEEEVTQRQLGGSLQKMLTERKKLVEVDEEMKVSQNNNYNIYQKNVIIVNDPIIKRFIEGGESWHKRAKRAGEGCPSRSKILKRLQRYEDPSVTLKNATYWRLVVQLSRYEDLGTKQPR